MKLCKNGILEVDHGYRIDYDWLEHDAVRFYPWENIESINDGHPVRRNSYRDYGKKVYGVDEIRKALSGVKLKGVRYPYLYATNGIVVYIVKGTPKSERSKGGKRRFTRDVQHVSGKIKKHYPVPMCGRVAVAVDVFSSGAREVPDLDRLCHPILDAFQGIVYEDDKQVDRFEPRLFNSNDAYEKLECTSDPMPHFELERIPCGSLFPLTQGILDYFVVRISTFIPTRKEWERFIKKRAATDNVQDGCLDIENVVNEEPPAMPGGSELALKE